MQKYENLETGSNKEVLLLGELLFLVTFLMQLYASFIFVCIFVRISVYFVYLGLVIGIVFFIMYRVYILYFFSVYYITLIYLLHLHCKWPVGPYAF